MIKGGLLSVGSPGYGVRGGDCVAATHGVNDGLVLPLLCIPLSSVLVSLLGILNRFV